MIGKRLPPIQEPAGKDVSIEKIKEWTNQRRHPVPDLVPQPALALRLCAEQPCIDLPIIWRGSGVEQFLRLRRGIAVVLGDPVGHALPILVNKIVAQTASWAIDDQMFIDRPILASPFAIPK